MTAFKNNLRIVLLTAALGMVCYGALTGGYIEVFSKAVMICMECIGIG